jgi:hypothetical protein
MNLKNIVKRVGILIVLSTLVQIVLAQKFDVKWGNKEKHIISYNNSILLENGNRLIFKNEKEIKINNTIKHRNTFLIVDNDFNELKEKVVEAEGDNPIYSGFEKFGNNIFLLYTTIDNKTKTRAINAQKIDKGSLEIISTTTLGVFDHDGYSNQIGPFYIISQDSSKIMAICQNMWEIDKSTLVYAKVYDKNFNLLNKIEIKLPIKYEKGNMTEKINGYYLLNNGNVCIDIFEYYGKKTFNKVDGKKVPNYSRKMYVYESNTKDLKQITLSADNFNYLRNGNILFDKTGVQATFVGLNSDYDKKNYKGVVYATLDFKDYTIKNYKTVDFPIEILSLVEKDNFGTDKKSDPGLFDKFRVANLQRRIDGSLDLVMEYIDAWSTAGANSKGAFTDYGTSYCFGDIINANITKDDKVTFTRIPKKQYGFNSYDALLGTFSFTHGNDLVILYNDDKDNVDRDLNKKPDDIMKFKNSVLIAATINSKGELKREAILNNDEDDFVPIVRRTLKETENKYIIVADLQRAFKLRTKHGVLIIN